MKPVTRTALDRANVEERARLWSASQLSDALGYERLGPALRQRLGINGLHETCVVLDDVRRLVLADDTLVELQAALVPLALLSVPLRVLPDSAMRGANLSPAELRARLLAEAERSCAAAPSLSAQRVGRETARAFCERLGAEALLNLAVDFAATWLDEHLGDRHAYRSFHDSPTAPHARRGRG